MQPVDTDAERLCIGKLLRAGTNDAGLDALARVPLEPQHFIDRRHALIFGAIRQVAAQAGAFDTDNVLQFLERNAAVAEVGGHAYLTELLGLSSTWADVHLQARLVAESYVRRRLAALEPGGDLLREMERCRGLLARFETNGAAGPTAKTWTADELLAADLPEPSWLVERLIVDEGFQVFAGKKKIGKSLAALQLAQAVAGGTDFLTRRVLKQGPVLYFALEDGERRIRSRLLKQNASPNLPITFCFAMTPLDAPGGLEELAARIAAAKSRLVVVDTLAAALTRRTDQDRASDMGALGNALRNLGRDHHSNLLIIAHHGKSSTGDPGFDQRGSSAQPGAVDASLGLYRENGIHLLRGEGRDLQDLELRVEFDSAGSWCWRLLGDHRKLAAAESAQQVLAAVAELQPAASVLNVATLVGNGRPWVQRQLAALARDGLLKSERDASSTKGRLVYQIVEPPHSDAHHAHQQGEGL